MRTIFSYIRSSLRRIFFFPIYMTYIEHLKPQTVLYTLYALRQYTDYIPQIHIDSFYLCSFHMEMYTGIEMFLLMCEFYPIMYESILEDIQNNALILTDAEYRGIRFISKVKLNVLTITIRKIHGTFNHSDPIIKSFIIFDLKENKKEEEVYHNVYKTDRFLENNRNRSKNKNTNQNTGQTNIYNNKQNQLSMTRKLLSSIRQLGNSTSSLNSATPGATSNKNDRSEIRNNLQVVCSDSGECLAFGHEQENINKLFRHFVDFANVKSATALPSESSNGFIIKLRFQSHSYTVNAILKSTLSGLKDSASEQEIVGQAYREDNLFYEYLVGMFLNKIGTTVPCFVQTYRLFRYSDKTMKSRFIENNIHLSDFRSLKVDECDTLASRKHVIKCAIRSCDEGDNFAILTQSVDDAISVWDMSNESPPQTPGYCYQILGILYQVYSVLSYLKNHFTHHDLHPNNVLLYKIQHNRYLTLDYYNEVTNERTILKTYYLAKIIDYGRCYFRDDPLIDSDTLYKRLPDSTCRKDFEIRQKNNATDLRLSTYFNHMPWLKDKIIVDYEIADKRGRTNVISSVDEMESHLRSCVSLSNSDGCIQLDDPLHTSVGTLYVRFTATVGAKSMKFVPT
jgi:hypothetical protein